MSKETRVIQLQKDLVRLECFDSLRALNWMIGVMNADNGYSRKDGSHYYYHLVDSTQDLINHGITDEITLTSCILHDSVEDIEALKINDLKALFGEEVAYVVEGVTKKEGINYKEHENMEAYLSEILRDFRRCLVKTADRKHNFSTLYATSGKHEIRQANETEKHFLPFFKKARKMYPNYANYFHSAKTTIVPHLKRIQKAHEEESRLKTRIEELEMKLEQERKRNNALENKIRESV
ncbi:GTP pyrophosphokinase [Bacillus phage vB_BcoS-136]|uniref:GTP pyrophosphokinase n=1 Tax=Bacillus phage vB_BcoS-136 TaxID=2419619 RepID=A0A3G3BVT9_9CAUD|nr:GTP pyrophosphokinase [Bacillus phage vB_BcoS-136]AYP68357.1 GTP pyrophosphokinase [Bacillus phage vB_BcoS-136]